MWITLICGHILNTIPNELLLNLKHFQIIQEQSKLHTFIGQLGQNKTLRNTMRSSQMLIYFLQKCISNHETKQASKFQSDPTSNCFTIDVWNINCWRQPCISLLSYCFFVSHFTAFYTSSVVFWDVIFWE